MRNKSRSFWWQPMCTTDFVTYQYSIPRPSAENNFMSSSLRTSFADKLANNMFFGHF